MRAREVLVVGAGPYGLSISAHLRARGVDHLIAGRTMDTWLNHAPAGMYMRSEPDGLDLSCPEPGFFFKDYCGSEQVAGMNYGARIPVETFIDYSAWYIKHLVPDVSDVTVTNIKAVNNGFEVAFAEDDMIVANHVVIATGVLPYRRMPAELAGLSSELVSHTSDHHRFDQFRGRRVAVVGGGSSAFETAALLREGGCEVQLVVRGSRTPFWDTRPQPLTPLRRLVTNRLCENWRCPVWNTPALFRLLPKNMRLDRGRTVAGLPGAWWLQDRVAGVIDVLDRTSAWRAEARGSGVRLILDGPAKSRIDVDHVIAGTGFNIDIARLTYLPEELQARIARRDGFPVLSQSGQSTVSGLYFAGAPAAFGLGPSMRFLAGTHNVAPALARSIARHAKGVRHPASTPAAALDVVLSPLEVSLAGTTARGGFAPSRSCTGRSSTTGLRTPGDRLDSFEFRC
jgi:FAD-dependent urate hydroxylase